MKPNLKKQSETKGNLRKSKKIFKKHWKPNENQCKNLFNQCQKSMDQEKTPKSIVKTMVFARFWPKT